MGIFSAIVFRWMAQDPIDLAQDPTDYKSTFGSSNGLVPLIWQRRSP